MKGVYAETQKNGQFSLHISSSSITTSFFYEKVKYKQRYYDYETIFPCNRDLLMYVNTTILLVVYM